MHTWTCRSFSCKIYFFRVEFFDMCSIRNRVKHKIRQQTVWHFPQPSLPSLLFPSIYVPAYSCTTVWNVTITCVPYIMLYHQCQISPLEMPVVCMFSLPYTALLPNSGLPSQKLWSGCALHRLLSPPNFLTWNMHHRVG